MFYFKIIILAIFSPILIVTDIVCSFVDMVDDTYEKNFYKKMFLKFIQGNL